MTNYNIGKFLIGIHNDDKDIAMQLQLAHALHTSPTGTVMKQCSLMDCSGQHKRPEILDQTLNLLLF